MKIGFIGQGWIGKNYADNFEKRGYSLVRYSLEKEYVNNVHEIKNCDIVFIAVPTPTTPQGFDSSNVEKCLALVGTGKIAIIKSTILPGTTEELQRKNPKIFLMHSPEFLRESSAAHDAAYPSRNIVGVPIQSKKYQDLANKVLSVLPQAPYNKIMHSREAELVKYIGNCFLYQKVVFFNQMFDLSKALGLDYENIRDAVVKDTRIGDSHTWVNHSSGHNPKLQGRGAGGHCFIKDYQALIQLYERILPKDAVGLQIFKSTRDKNYQLLTDSGKDLDLLQSVTKILP